jgi:N-acetylneuraminic acid mutarotase
MYDPKADEWTEKSSLLKAKVNASAVTMQDSYVYLFGGWHKDNDVNSIEKYDCKQDTWMTLDMKLQKAIQIPVIHKVNE